MKKYKPTKFIEKEQFTEMSRIRDIKTTVLSCSIWVNERGENREEPHFHIRMADKTVYRLRMKDLSDIDAKNKSDKDVLSSKQIKEIKKILLSPDTDDPTISSLRVSLSVWNKQDGNKHKIKMSDIEWLE